jgi:IS5 family transposase
MNPVLRAIHGILANQGEVVELVRKDLQRGLKNAKAGRNGMNPSQVLRSLVLMRVKNWDYRELQERIQDGVSLRFFTGFESAPVPKHDAFNRAFTRLTAGTMRIINESVIGAAVDMGLENGKQLRVDTTVVETNIHYPTDATLLWDAARTIQRLMQKLCNKLPGKRPRIRNRNISARRRMQQLQRMTAQQRSQQQTRKYRELIQIVDAVIRDGQALVKTARKTLARTNKPLPETTAAGIKQLSNQIEQYCERGSQVVDQTRRRVLQGEQVPSEAKVYSIFEPHTALIKRGKAQKPVEFGRKVFLAESAQGLITDYQVLDGNPGDGVHVPASLDRHRKTFQCVPELYASDRGFFSAENIQVCEQAGVSQICIPHKGGGKSAEQAATERTPNFKRGQRFRAGIEGRISVLFRGRGMKRCLAKGPVRFEVLVGAAVLTNNLLRIAQMLEDKSKKQGSKSSRTKSQVRASAQNAAA